MRIDILGLELDRALEMLEQEGITASVTVTRSPRRKEEEGGTLRVVYASDDGAQLTVSRFFDPIAERQEE